MDIFDRYYRVYASINLDYIEDNLKKIKDRIDKDTKLIAVIKTDAYGHGATMIAKHASADVDGFAVATVDEALQLRKEGISKPVIVLGYVNPGRYDEMINNDIRFTLFKTEDANAISVEAKKLNKHALVHIKADTGMGRIGFMVYNDRDIKKTAEIISDINKLDNMEIEGLYTHFALSDSVDKSFFNIQFNRFKGLIRAIEELGMHIPVKHCSNSAAIIDIPKANLDAVRVGIALYGLEPSDEVDIKKIGLKQAMEVKSHIIYIKDVPAGTSIGYGRTFITEKDSRIATVPVGYGDGYPRNLSNKGYVLVKGIKVPIVGRICMDQFMIDITGIDNIKEGDVVTLAGYDNGEFIDISELATCASTFNYEFVCDIGKRVPRIYYKNGEIVGAKDYFYE